MPTKTLVFWAVALTACQGSEKRTALRCAPDVTLAVPFTPLHPLKTFDGASSMLSDLVYRYVLSDTPGAATRVVRFGDDELLLEVLPAQFQDGRPVTAADVAASLMNAGQNLEAAASDAMHVRVRYHHGATQARSALAWIAVVPAERADEQPSWNPPPGSGAFRIESLTSAEARLVRWPNTSGPPAALASLTLHATDGPRGAWARAMVGETDLLSLGSDRVDGFLNQLPEWHLITVGSPSTYVLVPSTGARQDGAADYLWGALASMPVPPGSSSCSTTPERGLCLLSPGKAAANPGRFPRAITVAYWDADEFEAEAVLRLQQRLDAEGTRLDLRVLTFDEIVTPQIQERFDFLVSYTPIDRLEDVPGFLDAVQMPAPDTRAAVAAAKIDLERVREAAVREKPLMPWFTVSSTAAVRSPFDRFGATGRSLTDLILSWLPPEGCPR